MIRYDHAVCVWYVYVLESYIKYISAISGTDISVVVIPVVIVFVVLALIPLIIWFIVKAKFKKKMVQQGKNFACHKVGSLDI